MVIHFLFFLINISLFILAIVSSVVLLFSDFSYLFIHLLLYGYSFPFLLIGSFHLFSLLLTSFSSSLLPASSSYWRLLTFCCCCSCLQSPSCSWLLTSSYLATISFFFIVIQFLFFLLAPVPSLVLLVIGYYPFLLIVDYQPSCCSFRFLLIASNSLFLSLLFLVTIFFHGSSLPFLLIGYYTPSLLLAFSYWLIFPFLLSPFFFLATSCSV